jgi:hypothetical protein
MQLRAGKTKSDNWRKQSPATLRSQRGCTRNLAAHYTRLESRVSLDITSLPAFSPVPTGQEGPPRFERPAEPSGGPPTRRRHPRAPDAGARSLRRLGTWGSTTTRSSASNAAPATTTSRRPTGSSPCDGTPTRIPPIRRRPRPSSSRSPKPTMCVSSPFSLLFLFHSLSLSVVYQNPALVSRFFFLEVMMIISK